MRICFETRTVTMAIGEFAEFTDRPTASGGAGRGGGLWRAQLGQTWHEQLRRSLAERDPAAEFEVTISARWPHQHWTFQLQGRADQVVRGPAGVTIREVKTVDFPLPAHDLDLAAAYPGYFLQLQAYQRLYPLTEGREAGEVRAELIFVEIQTGMTQTVPVEPGTADPFLVQVERIYRFL
jgi:DNA excision repair protein ERCC-2